MEAAWATASLQTLDPFHRCQPHLKHSHQPPGLLGPRLQPPVGPCGVVGVALPTRRSADPSWPDTFPAPPTPQQSPRSAREGSLLIVALCSRLCPELQFTSCSEVAGGALSPALPPTELFGHCKIHF